MLKNTALVLLIIFISFFVASLFHPTTVSAQTQCDNRYLTIINPVRNRDLWHDKSLKPLQDQYDAISANNFSATWLVQYDIFFDHELLQKLNSFNPSQEKGVFLEVSNKLTNNARVVYPPHTPWFRPNAIFLSGYSQSDRRKLIDTLFNEFNSKFGYFPKSVGAWWIDSYSLEYLKQKYNITSALIVADQQTTDNYGVWGQWWGVPYYPSKANILTPASTLSNKQDVVILQWAQRDPLRAYGEGPAISNFSLQANDYIRQGKFTDYFKEISNVYLNCDNKLGQITVGLETGIESVGYIGEYANQLNYLKTQTALKSVTMSEFAHNFAKIYPEIMDPATISLKDSTWELTLEKRENQKLNDQIVYASDNSFSDYFLPDKSEFLNRRLDQQAKTPASPYMPYYQLLLIAAGLLFYLKRQFKLFLFAIGFLISSYGLLLQSYSKFGWNVYFGPTIQNLGLAQFSVTLVVLSAFWLITKQKYQLFKIPLFLGLLSLSFSCNFILTLLRYTVIEGRYYFGVALDQMRFVGFSFNKNGLQFINQDFEGSQLNAFLKINYDKIWQNNLLSLVIFPLIYIATAIMLFFVLQKLPRKIKIVCLSFLTILWICYLIQITQSDPKTVLPKI